MAIATISAGAVSFSDLTSGGADMTGARSIPAQPDKSSAAPMITNMQTFFMAWISNRPVSDCYSSPGWSSSFNLAAVNAVPFLN